MNKEANILTRNPKEQDDTNHNKAKENQVSNEITQLLGNSFNPLIEEITKNIDLDFITNVVDYRTKQLFFLFLQWSAKYSQLINQLKKSTEIVEKHDYQIKEENLSEEKKEPQYDLNAPYLYRELSKLQNTIKANLENQLQSLLKYAEIKNLLDLYIEWEVSEETFFEKITEIQRNSQDPETRMIQEDIDFFKKFVGLRF